MFEQFYRSFKNFQETVGGLREGRFLPSLKEGGGGGGGPINFVQKKLKGRSSAGLLLN